MKEKIAFFQLLLNGSEMAALAAGIICWRFIKDSKTKAFIIYLLQVILFEAAGWFLGRYGYKEINTWLYNYIVIPAEFIFCIWYLLYHFPSSGTRVLFWIFSILIVACSFTEFTFLNNEKHFFSSLSYVCSSLFLLIAILIFLFYFTKSDRIINYDQHFCFWVSVAMLLYYLLSFPLYAFYNYLYAKDKASFYIYWEIQMWLNIIMYLLFATGLLWTNIKFRR